MAKTSTPEGRSARWRRYLLVMVIAALTVMTLPLTGYLATGVSEAQAQQSGQQTNPRADYWRTVRDGSVGVSTVTGQETNVLIQNGAQNWRQLRNDVIARIGAWAIIAIIVALAVYHVLTGGNKLEKPLSGELVDRWSVVDRVLHWYTAVLFIILAITGLSLLWGRTVLIPVMGPEGFAAWANIAKPIHDYLALFFTVGLVFMLLKWMKHNFFKSYDLQWIAQGGGYLPNGKHPKAGFCNAGEKLLYWTLFFMGGAMVVSGLFLLFPNFGFERDTMQWANIIHGFTSLFVIGFICLHIYLATIGSPGALRGMTSGRVDATWAKQHHSVWYEEATGRSAGHAEPGGAAPTPAPAARMP